MSLIAKEKWGTKELIPAGIHLAKCISIIDLGTQKIIFEKKEKEVHQVRFEFELLNLKYTYEDKDTKEEVETTKVTWKNFTISLHAKATMRKFLESWRGRKFTKEELERFDLSKILGKNCQLQIIHSDDGEYANIENALPLMWGVDAPKWERELISFSIQEDEKGNPTGFDEEAFEKLPEWLQTKIQESKEMMKLFWIESLDDQEENMKKETEEKKAEKEEITTDKVEEIFDGEPKTTTKARAKAEETKKTEKKDDDFE